MSRQYSNASLGLMPVESTALTVAQLHGLCDELGLCGKPIDAATQRYYAGERFLGQINFLGCSPHIEFDGSDTDRAFTHIILHRLDTPKLYHGAHSRPPRCPGCGKANPGWLDDWPDTYIESSENSSIHCEHCQAHPRPEQIDWRRSAGYTDTLIEITDIFPREALPQPALLEKLGQETTSSWDYFYF